MIYVLEIHVRQVWIIAFNVNDALFNLHFRIRYVIIGEYLLSWRSDFLKLYHRWPAAKLREIVEGFDDEEQRANEEDAEHVEPVATVVEQACIIPRDRVAEILKIHDKNK